jgi:hypothetical protein
MYSTKAQKPVENMITLYLNAFERASARPNESETPEARGSGIVYSMLNAISNPQEICSSMASLYLLRGSPFYMSHSYENLSLDSGLIEVQGLLEVESTLDYSVKKNSYTPRVSSLIDYMHRPTLLNKLCYYDFVSSWSKSNSIPKKNALLFLDTHCQSGTHCLKRTKISNIIPNILGRRLPNIDNGSIAKSEKDRYYSSLQLLFKPFRTAEEIKPEVFDEWDMSEAAKRFALNNLDYYECREMQAQFKDPELAHFKEMQKNCVDNGY